MKKGRDPKTPAELLFSQKKGPTVPFPFVLDALQEHEPWTRPMFGCLAVYVEDQIVLVLRDKADPVIDNGVWVPTLREHHKSLRKELASLRSITVLGPDVTAWQVIPTDSPNFEEEVLRAVEMVKRRDPRIGKTPKARRPKE